MRFYTGLFLALVFVAGFCGVSFGQGLFNEVGTTLVVPAGETVIWSGTIEDFVECQGTISCPEDSTEYLKLKKGVAISGSGNVNTGRYGYVYVKDENSSLSGGDLATYRLDILTGYDGGSVKFVQDSGVNTCGSLRVSNSDVDKSAVYHLKGTGQLNAESEFIDGFEDAGGLLIHEGGRNNADSLKVRSAGQYIFTSGELAIRNGFDLAGTLDCSGGDGVISAGEAFVNFADGTILNAGGTSLEVGPNSLVIYPAGRHPSTVFGSFSSQGIVHEAGSTLVVAEGQGFRGEGTISDHVECGGTITLVQTGLYFLGGVDLLPGGKIINNESFGCMNIQGRSEMQGGEVSLGTIEVLGSNTEFIQRAGAVETMAMMCYDLSGGEGATYRLEGGSVTSWGVDVGIVGKGRWEQTGGTLDVAYSMSIGKGYLLRLGKPRPLDVVRV